MKITAMKITPSHKLTQQVKHPATTWPDLILPFSPRGQRIWSTSVFFKCVSSPSYATSRDKEKRMKSLHATWWHKANSPDTAPYLSSNDFSVFPLRHLVAQSRSPRHTAQSVSDGFFFLTPPRGTFCSCFLFFFFFLHHLVAQSRSPRHTAQNGPRRTIVFFFFPFLTPPRGTFSFFFTPPCSTEQTFSTHC